MWMENIAAPGAHVGANFNYNSSLVDFYANIGLRYMNHESENYSDRYSFERLALDSYEDVREQWGDTLSYLNTLSDSRRNFLGLFARVGADFHTFSRAFLQFSAYGLPSRNGCFS